MSGILRMKGSLALSPPLELVWYCIGAGVKLFTKLKWRV